MKFPPASTYLSRIATDVASSVVVPNRIAPRLSALTLRAGNVPLPMVVYRIPPRWQFARARSQGPQATWVNADRRAGIRQVAARSGERRVGEEWRSRWLAEHLKKKKEK